MKEVLNKKFWSYIGRFTLIYIITYTFFASLFMFFQDALPHSARVALEFFEPYRPLALTQVIRVIVLALILYPFYNTIVSGRRGWLILFGALWGLALVGSLEPMPGSIEGIIYTETTFTEHVEVLLAGALQISVFCCVFLKWEIWSNKNRDSWESNGAKDKQCLKKYVGRFTLLHVTTYWTVGMIFYQLLGYEEALDSEIFELFRPLESILMVAVVFLGQIMRGGILALLLYPFYDNFMSKKHGWLFIFILLWGLTALGSWTFIPNLLQNITKISLNEFIESIKIGVPEITVKALLCSWLLFRWEKWSMSKNNSSCKVIS